MVSNFSPDSGPVSSSGDGSATHPVGENVDSPDPLQFDIEELVVQLFGEAKGCPNRTRPNSIGQRWSDLPQAPNRSGSRSLSLDSTRGPKRRRSTTLTNIKTPPLLMVTSVFGMGHFSMLKSGLEASHWNLTGSRPIGAYRPIDLLWGRPVSLEDRDTEFHT